MTYWIENADSALLLPTLPAASVDALVTDPPAGIGFMGKEWDDFRRARNPADAGRDSVHGRLSRSGPEYGRRDRENFITWLAGILHECRRLMKPGAYGWVWAIPRTSHWTAMACEDAGFTVRDVMTHVFGCLTEDAELLTATGWKKYTDIQVGDLTLGLTPNGAFIWQPVRQVHTYDHEQIAYRVHSANTDHIVTAGHRMLVENTDGWAIRTADEVASQREVRVPTIQDLPALLSAIPVPQSASGCTKQVLYPDLCRVYTETVLEKAETCLQTLFENFSTEEPSCTRQSEVCSYSCRTKFYLPSRDMKSVGAKGKAGWTEASLASYRAKMSGAKNPAWKGGVTQFRAHGNYSTPATTGRAI